VTTYVGLLRAVNVAGHNSVAMADLRDLFERLGLRDARTLLQSGNVVFGGPETGSTGLERLLEAGAAEHLGLEIDFFIRSAREWRSAVERNPFPDAARRNPARLALFALKRTPAAAAVKALADGIKGRETLHADGRHLYVLYPDGMGRSRLTVSLIERTLGGRGTARNWNTVLKLAARAGLTSAT
jgi:uncharacterized protein (DUF1697 family)